VDDEEFQQIMLDFIKRLDSDDTNQRQSAGDFICYMGIDKIPGTQKQKNKIFIKAVFAYNKWREEMDQVFEMREAAIPGLVDMLEHNNEDEQRTAFGMLRKIIENIKESINQKIEENKYLSALEEIKDVTGIIMKSTKPNRIKGELLEKAGFESLAAAIRDKMNSDRKTFPVERQEVKKSGRRPAGFLRT